MKNLTMKEINEKYVNRIIESLVNHKELWTREVMCGMGTCIVSYHSPKYTSKDGGDLQFSDMGLISAHIDGKLAWEIPSLMYYNPFSNQSRQLRRAMDTMKVYLIEKQEQEYRDKLSKSIE